MVTLRNRHVPSSAAPKLFPSVRRLILNTPKRLDREHELIAPIPFHYFLIRGIVPMLATNPEARFNWRSATNTRITRRHAVRKTVLANLKSLIKSGRKYRGRTPGITIQSRKGRAIRYEYWPMFDEFVDESEWVPSWPKKTTSLGNELSWDLARELRELFCRPALMPETVDF